MGSSAVRLLFLHAIPSPDFQRTETALGARCFSGLCQRQRVFLSGAIQSMLQSAVLGSVVAHVKSPCFLSSQENTGKRLRTRMETVFTQQQLLMKEGVG